MNNQESVRCRLCGNQLKATNGCDLCLRVKGNLIWPIIEDASDNLSATEVINTTLKAMRRRLKRLSKEMANEGSDYQTALTRDLVSISRALKELAGEQRKLEDREEEHYAKLGMEGRMNLFIEDFFSQLPEEFQIKLLQGMKKTFERQNQSLLQE